MRGALYPQKVGRNINEILRTVKALQTLDQFKVATPANCLFNSLIGDKVILPPPSSINEAHVHLHHALQENNNCYDWWFCFKSLS